MGRGELELREPHPAAQSAMAWLQGVSREQLCLYMEAFASCAIEGNRLAEICGETLRRVLHGEPVSDRYLLGLVWTLHGNIESATIQESIADRLLVKPRRKRRKSTQATVSP